MRLVPAGDLLRIGSVASHEFYQDPLRLLGDFQALYLNTLADPKQTKADESHACDVIGLQAQHATRK